MPYKDFVLKLHTKTKRNYLERVCDHDKAHCATIAKEYGAEYWDGHRQYGYGGHYYDGRWAVVAEEMIEHYKLHDGMRVLDIGCGKGFLLYELQKLLPALQVSGVDISQYALDNAKEEVKKDLQLASAPKLPFADDSFDLVISLGTFHNLKIFELQQAISELNRVVRQPEMAYLMVESFRNEEERVNLLYWQLTCESFYDPEEWQWLYNHFGYQGDYSYIFFT